MGIRVLPLDLRPAPIAVRMALEAAPHNVLRMVLAHGLGLAAVGVTLGLAASFGLTRLLRSLLFHVRPTDPSTFVTVTLILLAAVLGACWVTARRAMRVDPMVALRYE